MKIQEFENLSDKDLMEKIKEEKANLHLTKFNHNVAGTENPMNIREKRRDIARMYTVLNNRKGNNQ
ncbi:MAG: Ribosomal protein [Bacteroidota bacterium]|jgi:large subunit ribosomal protein L29